MNRRDFLKSTAALGCSATAASPLGAISESIPVIDSHIHLFDPTRPGGVPWPKSTDRVLYQPALPPRYVRLAAPHEVVGAIAVECSPWMVDNFWLLNVVEQNPTMLGFIGNLLPEAPDFAATLDLLHRSPLFLGIRYGNLWNRDLGVASQAPEFISGLKLLSEARLVMETANPDPALIAAAIRVSDRVPDLRIVIDHLPNAVRPADAASRSAFDASLRELSQRPKVFVKGSEIVRRIDGQIQLDPDYYKDALSQLWDSFGESRILFGSDWPNSDSLASYGDTFNVAQHFIATRGVSAQRMYFWENSTQAYKWRARTSPQAKIRSQIANP